MAEHVLKVQPPYFDALLDGSKTFEVRRNDRAFQKGDTLILLDTDVCECTNVNCTLRANGRGIVRRVVTFVYAGDPRFGGHGGLAPGHVVLALGPGGDRDH